MFLQAQLNSPMLIFFVLVQLSVLLFCAGISILLFKCLKKVKPGQAIIRTGAGGTQVIFEKALLIPTLHEFEVIDIAIKKLTYERVGTWALKFKCGTRVELTADLMLRLNRETEDIKRGVQALGCQRINDQEQLREFYSSMFNDSLETVAGKFEYETFASDKRHFRDAVLEEIGTDLNGMVTEDLCLHHLQKL